MRLELQLRAKPKIGGCQGEAPGRLGGPLDDGKRLRACEKRLELQTKAKPNVGGLGGRHRQGWARRDDGKRLRACEKRLELQLTLGSN